MWKDALLAPIVSAEHSIDPDAIIRDKKILLVDLSTSDGDISDTVNTMLGTILFIKMVSAAFRQLKTPEHQRVRHFLFVDEAGSFMHKGMDWQRVYSQARKVKFSLVLACQQLSQLTDKVLEAMWGNAGVIASFTVAEKDAKEFAKNFPGTTAEEFAQQKKRQCIACVNETLLYRVRTRLPQKPEHDQTGYIEMKMRDKATTVNVANTSPKGARDEQRQIDSRFVVSVCPGVR